MRPVDLGKMADQMRSEAAPAVLCMGGYVFVNPLKAEAGSMIRQQLEQKLAHDLLVPVSHGYGSHVEIYHSTRQPEPIVREKKRLQQQMFRLNRLDN